MTPRTDPLAPQRPSAQVYVYAAEVLAAAIGLHVWLTMPWLFKGFLINYWMLIVMAVAFAGAGLAEWFQRRRLPVLASPCAHGASLAASARGRLLDRAGGPRTVGPGRPRPGGVVHDGRVLRRAGRHAAVVVVRRTVGPHRQPGTLGRPGLVAFPLPGESPGLRHPAGPGGACGRVSQSRSLERAQSAAFRYLMLSAIYISSTADMFIAGLGNSWSLPLVLMLLSVAGMLAGIWLRVRSFLFLGLTFLVLDALSMIWYAAHDLHNTWLWYLCGIALGAAILAMFAVFEKRRGDILAAVERMQAWSK